MVRKIIACVDPFQESEPLQKNYLATLSNFAEATGSLIEPVYVLDPDQVEFLEAADQAAAELHRQATDKALAHALSELRNALPPRVIPRRVRAFVPAIDAVHAVETDAVSSGADLIAVATHARGGFVRLLLGSFAESMVLRSRLPVLSLNPETPAMKTFSNVIFSTDLSAESRFAFYDAIRLALSLHAPLTIFGRTGHMPGYERRRRQLTALKWLSVARRAKTEARLALEPNASHAVEAVVSFTRRNPASILVLSDSRRPLAAHLTGNVTRRILRTANCPVWIHRPAHERTLRHPEESREADVAIESEYDVHC